MKVGGETEEEGGREGANMGREEEDKVECAGGDEAAGRKGVTKEGWLVGDRMGLKLGVAAGGGEAGAAAAEA